jgi:hypothetical protein
MKDKMKSYNEFLEYKNIVDIDSGFEITEKINKKLFEFQKDIVIWALRRGRAAIFADCGLGKTPIQLEWAKHVNLYTKKPVLILAPLAVSKQTEKEGIKFEIKVNICESKDDVINGINITNYEKLHKFDCSVFSGVVLDESSILKSYTGATRNNIIDSFKRTPYKLACTATPAPNDFVELGNHSEFLNILSRSEMLSLFFINDTSNIGTWRLKKYGQNKFWQWLCSWAVMLSMPSELGYDNNGFVLPKLNIIEHVIKIGKPNKGEFFAQRAKTLNERRSARRDSIEDKIDIIKKIISKDEPYLIWCDLNKESEALNKEIAGSIEITGSQDNEFKENSMMGFSSGKYKILITKPKIGGFGMNWQHCNNVIFVGLSDSYEAFYQAIRRCWRFGQKKEVNCHIITTDIEGNIVDNIKRKEADSQKMRKEMIANMQDISKNNLKKSIITKTEYKTEIHKGTNYEVQLGDSVELIKNIKSDSIGFSIFSPPFASLFTYTDSIRDMGNCRDKNTFLEHFRFLVKELYRVISPGRIVAIHCMNLPMTITHDGVMGLHDFRGDLIYLFQSEKFIYHSEVCIWKDPLIQAVRTKALTLAHKQVVKDSSRCGQGLADYLVVMRKPGINDKPINRDKGFTEYIGEREFTNTNFNEDQSKNKLSHEIWQRYASPVWFDIRQTRVLNSEIARDDKDEKHVCPLQLDVIERALELWSAEDDIVLDPFNGIGSTIYSAVKMKRKGIGFELKESYYNQTIKNMKNLERELKRKSFDLV